MELTEGNNRRNGQDRPVHDPARDGQGRHRERHRQLLLLVQPGLGHLPRQGHHAGVLPEQGDQHLLRDWVCGRRYRHAGAGVAEEDVELHGVHCCWQRVGACRWVSVQGVWVSWRIQGGGIEMMEEDRGDQQSVALKGCL